MNDILNKRSYEFKLNKIDLYANLKLLKKMELLGK